jgi:hypothetical protein
LTPSILGLLAQTFVSLDSERCYCGGGGRLEIIEDYNNRVVVAVVSD